MLSLQQLTQPLKRSDAASWLLSTLTSLGFQTTGWQPGRIQQVILNAVATAVAPFSQTGVLLAKSAYSETATGAALRMLSKSRFDNAANAAEKTSGPMILANAGTSPQTIVPGQLIITDGASQFGNLTGGTLPAGGTLSIDVEALLAGSAGNIGNDSTLTLVTSLAGVTVTNPGPSVGVPWYTLRTGSDIESNLELRQRNATKWGLLSIDKTSTGLKALALKQTGISKANVVDNNPRGPFTADLYVSGLAALISTPQIEDAQAAFAEYIMGTEAVWPPTESPYPSTIRLYHPTPVELLLQGVVYFDPQFTQAEVETELAARLDAFVEGVPLGGKKYANGALNLVTIGDIIAVIENTRGVLSSTLTTPAGNVVMASNDLLVKPAAGWFAGNLDLVAGITS